MPQNGFEQLSKILRSYRNSSVLFAAHELGVLNKISEKSINISSLVNDLGLSKKGLERLLSALCALGIIKKENNTYSISSVYKNYLDPRSSDFLGGLIDHEIHLHKRWAQLSESVKSGLPVKKTNEPAEPADTQRFIKAMANIGQRTAPILLEQINFNGNEHLLDLGGGPGKYIEKFCAKYPHMQVTIFDQPETIKAAKSLLSRNKNLKNIRFISGNFLEDDFGDNYDVIFSSNVIHIFGSEDVQFIFNKCYTALKMGGRLLIKDFFLNNDTTGPEFTTLFSLHMLLSSEGGKCYTEEEMISLMKNSHFSYKQSVKLTENTRVIEAIK
jgi:ubiquinone/menaquinone biosynthesis C-methylase UbiE